MVCPKCLKLVVNPNARIPPVIEPRYSLSIEKQTKIDLLDNARLLHILWISLLAGGILIAAKGNDLLLASMLIGMALLIAILTGLWFAKDSVRYMPYVDVEPSVSSEGQIVLDYARPVPRRQPSVHFGPFMSGFFISIIGTVLCFIALFSTKSINDLVLLVIVAAATVFGVAYMLIRLGKEERFHGLGRGVIVGLILATLAICPFGACALML
jgi:hypothetical protein